MSDWNPTTAELRDGETRDETSHARRNAEQLRRAVEDGDLDEDDLSDSSQELLDRFPN